MSRLRTLGWRSLVAYGGIAFIINSILPAAAMGAPLVRIARPDDGAVVSAKTAIDVYFRSDSQRPITRLEIYVDEALAIQWNLATPKLDGYQSFSWDFSFATATPHKIAARAIDSGNAVGTAAISVTVRAASAATAPPAAAPASGVDNIPPVVSIYYPAQGAHLSKKVAIKADATDNTGVKTVFFYIDGKLKTMIFNSPPFVDEWDTSKVADGTHVLQAEALDAAENKGVSSEVTVVVENHNMTALQATAAPATGQVLPGIVAPPATGPQAPTVTPPTTSDTAPAIVAPVAPATQSVPVLTPPVSPVAVPTGANSTVQDRQIATRDFNRQVAPGPASVERAAYQLSLSAPPPGSGLAAAQSELRLASLAGVRTSAPDGAAPAAPMVMPAAASATSVVAVAADGRPGSVSGAASFETKIASAAGLRTSAPESLLSPTGETPAPPAAGAPRGEATGPAGVVLASLPATDGGELCGQRTGMPSTSLIRPAQESAAALLARSDVYYVTPRLVLRPQAQVAALGSAAAQKLTIPTAKSGVAPREHNPTRLAMLPPTVASAPDMRPTRATAAKSPVRIAALPPTEGVERITIPGQPIGTPVAVTPASLASVRNLKVLFDNKELAMRANPELKQGIPMTALREIFEKTDGVMYWYPVTKQVRAVNDRTDVRLQIGSKKATVNQQAKTLPIAPYLKCGRTMVPLQFVADTLDVTVKYDPQSGQIVITSNRL